MTYVPTPTTDTPEITAFLESWVGALRARDAGAYAACSTDDVRVFDGMNPPQHRGIASWREMISTWFSGVGTEPDLVLKDVEVEVEGDLAVVTALAGYWRRDGEAGSMVPTDERSAPDTRRLANLPRALLGPVHRRDRGSRFHYRAMRRRP